MKHLLLLLSIALVAATARAQVLSTGDSTNAATQVAALRPKREFRGAWIATMANIDWPSAPGLSTERQQAEITAMLDSLKALGFNAIIFQVRPTADAFYHSELEPWSAFLTGSQTAEPSPYYDPLAFVIHEAHSRDIDVHVWLNPYRVLNQDKLSILSPGHIYFRRPHLFVKYGGKYYFNPGLDETRQYLNSVVADIVTRYDIDAVHLDDYFYPYRVAGQEFPDEETYRKNPRGFTNKDDWRRNNVNLVIEELSHTIKQIKPWVEFGISPFGVWRNSNRDARGSHTRAGTTNYDDLYADVLLWLERGWIDYVAPQLYWEIGHRAADYDELLGWWSRHTAGRNLYIGLYASGLEINKTDAWRRPNELCRQISLNDRRGGTDGVILYSARPMLRNPEGITDSLSTHYFHYPALPPDAPGSHGIAPPAPDSLHIEQFGIRRYLCWRPIEDQGGQAISSYVVYCFPGDTDIDIERADRIVCRAHDDRIDLTDMPLGRYVVTAINRFHLESSPSVPVLVTDLMPRQEPGRDIRPLMAGADQQAQ